MSISEFSSSTLGETLTWTHARSKAREHAQRNTGEFLRWIGSLIVNAFGGKKYIKPTDLFKFPDEETMTAKTREVTDEDKRIFEKMRLAALKFQENGNDRKRNNKNRGNGEAAGV